MFTTTASLNHNPPATRPRRFLPRTLDLDRSFYLLLALGFLLWKGTIFSGLLASIGFENSEAVTIAFGAVGIEVALYHGAFSPRFPKNLKLIYLFVGVLFSIMSVVTVSYALYKKSADQVQFTQRSLRNEKSIREIAKSFNAESTRLKKIIADCEARNYFTNCRLTGRDRSGVRRYISVGELEQQRRALQKKWIKKQDQLTKFKPDIVQDDFFVKIGAGNQDRGMASYAFSRAVILELAALLFLFTFYFLSGKRLIKQVPRMCEGRVFLGLGQDTLMARARHAHGTRLDHPSPPEDTNGKNGAEIPPTLFAIQAPQRATELALSMADELTTCGASVAEKNAAIAELVIAGEVPLSAIALGELFRMRPETIRNQVFPAMAKQGWIVAYDHGGKTYYRKATPEDGAEAVRFGHYGWVLNIPENKRKGSFPYGFFDSGVRNGEYQRAKSRGNGFGTYDEGRGERVKGSDNDNPEDQS